MVLEKRDFVLGSYFGEVIVRDLLEIILNCPNR
jgi:hypothetical protein